MYDAQSAARIPAHRDGTGSALVVLVEDDDGGLDVLDTGDGSIDRAALTGSRLDELVVEQDRPALRAVQQRAHEDHDQDACRVRLAVGEDPTRWFEVRYLPDIARGEMVVLLGDITHERRVAAEAAVLRRITELANSTTGTAGAYQGSSSA